MPRDFATVNLAIWQDPDFRQLPSDAKLLYLALWTHPQLSRAGVVDWRPGRLAALVDESWTADHVRAVGACLEARLFIVVDEQTEECLIRSWVRFDGLMKSPVMCVTFANEYAPIISSAIRGVIVHELHKLRTREPEFVSWTKSRVLDVLEMPSIDPRSRNLPTDPFTPGLTPTLTPSLTPSVTETPGVGVAPPANHPPTTAPSPTPTPAPKERVVGNDAKRGTRVPEDFSLTPEMTQWAAENTPDVDPAAATAEFIDYWRGVPGQKGIKLDWISTWRNGMRKQQKWAEENRDKPRRSSGSSYSDRTMNTLRQERERAIAADQAEAEQLRLIEGGSGQ